jgi:hypothetical protein
MRQILLRMVRPMICAAFLMGLAGGKPALVPIFDARLFFPANTASAKDIAILNRDVLPWARAYWARPEHNNNCSKGFEQFGPNDVTTGAFTRRGAKQRAVLYLYCSSGHNFEYSGVAVLEGNQVVANVALTGNQYAIGALPDLDGDGLQELLTRSGSTHMGGVTQEMIQVFHFRRGVERQLIELKVSDDNCGGLGESGFFSKVVRIYARRGTQVQFLAEAFTDSNACLQPKPVWKKLVSLKLLRGRNVFEVLPNF